ncbi:hypothetical protein CB1_000459005 [Camelus ferus]|nr:hypothetical protein CB1_000459005 [Camelus ferus]
MDAEQVFLVSLKGASLEELNCVHPGTVLERMPGPGKSANDVAQIVAKLEETAWRLGLQLGHAALLRVLEGDVFFASVPRPSLVHGIDTLPYLLFFDLQNFEGGLSLSNAHCWLYLLSELWFAFLDCGHHRITHTSSRQSFRSSLDPLHRDDTQTFGSFAVSAVDHGSNRMTQGNLEFCTRGPTMSCGLEGKQGVNESVGGDSAGPQHRPRSHDRPALPTVLLGTWTST